MRGEVLASATDNAKIKQECREEEYFLKIFCERYRGRITLLLQTEVFN